LAVLVVPLALWVLYNGYRKHGNRLTLVAATAGALLILAGLVSPMVHSDPIVEFSVPAFLSDTPATAEVVPASAPTPAAHAAATPTCSEACCPTITHNAIAGTANIAMPPGGLLTLLGSVLLVLAHTSNLIACRCFSKNTCNADGSSCGCPA
ncbi:MAG: MerC domain-containing protein, partial [Phycisphaeraceae bacterium]